MKLPFGDRVERGRERTGQMASSPGDDFGFFFLRMNGAHVPLRIMVSAGCEEVPWEHVSVSLPTRTPTWEEMAWVKGLFWDDEETVIQFHPPKSEYVSYHPYCLHLWRSLAVPFPRPPTIAVGPMSGHAVPR